MNDKPYRLPESDDARMAREELAAYRRRQGIERTSHRGHARGAEPNTCNYCWRQVERDLVAAVDAALADDWRAAR